MSEITMESCIFHGSRCHITPDTIRELVKLGLIVRIQRRSKENRRVYVDNHYSIVRFEVGHIRAQMPKMRSAPEQADIILYHPAALCRICPEVRSAVWGSP